MVAVEASASIAIPEHIMPIRAEERFRSATASLYIGLAVVVCI